MSHVSLPAHRPVAEPRFAPIAADWFARLLEVLHLGRQIHAVQREQTQRLRESSSLRRYADSVRGVDPRFASDLYAAADRHEWCSK
jgi:hypothetical protein